MRMKEFALFSLVVFLTFAVFAAPPVPVEKPKEMCGRNCMVSDAGLSLIRRFEGYVPFVYADAVGIATIGYGHVVLPGEIIQQPLLPNDADSLLRRDVAKTERGMATVIEVALWQYQHDALISLAFNVGTGKKLRKSTLIAKVNAEKHVDVPQQFQCWIYAGGKKLPGLIKRRMAEATLYANG